MEDYIPDQKSLTLVQIWILIALGSGPCHIYGLKGRIFGASVGYVAPNGSTLRSAVMTLTKLGLIEVIGFERGKASRFRRKLYVINDDGLRALYYEQSSLGMANQGIERALARRAVRGRVDF
jgi:DNA-binding PadR family transcriptional regulator